jgi:hypothetical protein
MSRWFRVYDNMLDDPKVQRLSPDLFKVLINLWCLCSQNDGWLPEVEDVAFRLRIDPAAACAYLATLANSGLIDQEERGLRPHNWETRQYKSDSPNERVRLWRQRQRENVTLHETSLKRYCNGADTDTDTEEERKKDSRSVAEATRPKLRDEFEQFWKAYPTREGPNPKAPAEKKFIAARKSGVPLEAILAGVRGFRAECERLRRTGTQFVPRADTWLNQRCWGDYSPQLLLLERPERPKPP